MFIVNQDGDLCVNLERLSYIIDWDDKTQDELNNIYSRIYSKAYHYGSIDNCLHVIKVEQDRYIALHKPGKVLKIYINGDRFGVYEDVEEGISVFKKIIEGIKSNCSVIDLSL